MSGCAEWIQRWLIYCGNRLRDQRRVPKSPCWVLQVQKTGNEAGRPPPLRNHCRGLRAHSASLTSTHTPHHTDTHTETQTHALHADTHYTQTHYTQLTRQQLRKAMYTEGVAPGQWLPDRACSSKTLPLQEKNKTKQEVHRASRRSFRAAWRRKEAAVHRRGGPQSEGRSLTGEGGARTRGGRCRSAPPRCFPGNPAGPCL